MDPEVKSHVLPLGSGGGCSAGAGVVGKLKFALPSSTTVSLKLLYLSAKRAACLRLIEDNPEGITCASTFDAARAEKPAVDLLMTLSWGPRLGKTFVAAPKEPRSRHPTPQDTVAHLFSNTLPNLFPVCFLTTLLVVKQ